MSAHRMASTRLLRVLQTSALSRVAVARICPTASDGNIARPHPSSNQSGLLKCFGPPSPWQSASLGPATSCVSRTLHTSPPSHFDPFGLFNAVTAVAERVQERFKDASVLLLPPELPHNPMTGKMKELKDVFSDLRKKNRGAAVTMYVNCQEFPSVATQLARDFGGEYYSKERRLPKRSRVVATLDASSEDSLERSYYELAKRLNCDIGMYNLEVKTFTQNYEQRLSAIVNEVKAKLRERAGWLLIIHNDNSNSKDAWNPCIPVCHELRPCSPFHARWCTGGVRVSSAQLRLCPEFESH